MRTKDLILIAIVLLLLQFNVGCQKEPANNTPVQAPIIDSTYSRELGWISYDYNGEFHQQQRNAYYSVNNQVSSFMITYGSPYIGLYEQISFSDLIFKDTFQVLQRGIPFIRVPTANSLIVLDGDQVLQFWTIDTLYSENYVEFTRIDTVLQRVKGVFQVRLIKTEPNPPPGGYPDTIELTNGRFYLEYEKV